MTRKASAFFIAAFLLFLFGFFYKTETPPAKVSAEIYTTLTNIWEYSSRSLSVLLNRDQISNTLIVDSSDIQEISGVIAQNKTSLEKLSGEPVVKIINDAEDPSPINLSEKLAQTQKYAANIYSGVQNLKSRTDVLSSRWPDLAENDIKSELTNLASIFTQSPEQKDINLIASTDWLKTAWDSKVLINLHAEAEATQRKIDNLLSEANSTGKASSPSVLDPLITSINQLELLTGSTLAQPIDPTLFGFVKKITDQIALFDIQVEQGIKILTAISDYPAEDHTKAILELKNNILGSNLVPNSDLFFSASSGDHSIANEVLDLLAIVNANKLLLTNSYSQIMTNTWLEEGSVVLRIAVTNPSWTKIQTANINLLLPVEITRDQIISQDPKLTLGTDTAGPGMAVSGEFPLAPQETRTFRLEMEDVWVYNPVEIKSLTDQVNELTGALKNTAKSAEAITLENEIESGIEKIIADQKLAITPETRIIAFRSSLLEVNKIEDKISSLKSLYSVTHSSKNFPDLSNDSLKVPLFGALAVLLSGVFFFLLYKKAVKTELKRNRSYLSEAKTTHNPVSTPQYRYHETVRPRVRRLFSTVVATLIFGSIGSLGISLAIKGNLPEKILRNFQPNGSSQVLGTTTGDLPLEYPYEAKLVFPESVNIPVRSSPSISSPQISSLKVSKTISVFDIVDHWALIMNRGEGDKESGWWIHDSFIEK